MIEVKKTEAEVARAAAQLLTEHFAAKFSSAGAGSARSAAPDKADQKFSLVLSGGNTPKRTFEVLASDEFKNKIDWARVEVFWSDERRVPPTDSRSNFKMAHDTLLAHVNIPSSQIHPMKGEREPFEDALDYELTLRDFFGQRPPHFDFVFLGLGTDGHTASLFPNTEALDEKRRWVTTLKNPTDDFYRLSLTPQILNLSRATVFLVTGKEKKSVVAEIINAKSDAPPKYPAQLIQPTHGELIWLLDEAAAPSRA